MSDQKDAIIDQCFRLFHLWSAGGSNTENFSRYLNGLWELLWELDPADYAEIFKDGVTRKCDELGNLMPPTADKAQAAPTTPDNPDRQP